MKLLNVKEAAKMLGIEVQTLYGWVHYKKISFVKVGGLLKFKEDEILEYINSRSFVPES